MNGIKLLSRCLKPCVAFVICLVLIPSSLEGKSRERIKVWSYNMLFDYLWVSDIPEHQWRMRLPRLVDAVMKYQPDIIGSQEIQTFQVRGFIGLTGYGWVGVDLSKGRRDGIWPENAAIFYRRDRFEVVDQGNFWFSLTPEKPGTYAWGMKYPRMCTWAKFRDKKTGKEFAVLNSHFYVDADKEEARKQAARLVLSKSKQLAKDCPVICTGDLNASIENESIQILLSDGTFRDSRALAKKPKGPEGSYHGFGKVNPPTHRIDHVLVSSEFRVMDYEIIDEQLRTQKYESDHLPVSVVLEF